jgi:hypothetical protein
MSQMSKTKKPKNPNADLVAAVRNHSNQILKFHDQAKDQRPLIVLDFQRRKLHSYSFEEYKDTLRQNSRALLDHEYKKALAKNKVLVVVWDKSTRRLVTTTFAHR